MSKVLVGQEAPAIELRGPNGKPWTLSEALEKGPAVVAFFKVSCPVCQLTFPFLERLYRAYGGDHVAFWGISQDNAHDTQEFCDRFGIHFPALRDEQDYLVSNKYGLTNVPTFFLIGQNGKVLVASVGFAKQPLEAISKFLTQFLKSEMAPVFLPGETVPDYKPG